MELKRTHTHTKLLSTPFRKEKCILAGPAFTLVRGHRQIFRLSGGISLKHKGSCNTPETHGPPEGNREHAEEPTTPQRHEEREKRRGENTDRTRTRTRRIHNEDKKIKKHAVDREECDSELPLWSDTLLEFQVKTFYSLKSLRMEADIH